MSDAEHVRFEEKSKMLLAVKQGRLNEAQRLVDQYVEKQGKDADIFSIEALMKIIRHEYDEALRLLRSGYRIESDNVNLLVNFASCFEKTGQYHRSLAAYRHAMDNAGGENRVRIQDKIDRIESDHGAALKNHPLKIIFFVKQGMDTFLDDIIFALSETYEIRKCIVTEREQIDRGMAWADICWFEWCNEVLAYASQHRQSGDKTLISRIHRYDLFGPYADKVAWENVDRIIVVTRHMKRLLLEKAGDGAAADRICVIQNGIDPAKYRYRARGRGFNIAFSAIMRLIKNPAMPLQILRKLVDIDPRYRLFVAGTMPDPWAELYWHHQIKRMGLEEHVVFDGWQEEMDLWLEDKDYLLSTSFYESFGFTIAEAMAKGIKPVIHDFPYAEEIWPEHLLFNTIEDAVAMITAPEYEAVRYRDYILGHHAFHRRLDEIRSLIESLCAGQRHHTITSS